MGGGQFNTMPSENMRPLRWSTISPELAHTLWNIHTKNPLAVRCRALVMSHLFSSNIEVLDSDGKPVIFDTNFFNFFQRRYKEFCYDVYDMYMVFGIVPIVFVQYDNGHYFPCVPKYGSFKLQCAYAVDRERMYFRVMRPKALKVYKNDDEGGVVPGKRSIGGLVDNVQTRAAWEVGSTAKCPTSYNLNGSSATGGHVSWTDSPFGGDLGEWVADKAVHIITGLGSDPGIDGELRSPLSSLVGHLVLTSSLTRYMLVSERRMTDPPMTMQFHKTEDPDDLEKYRKYTVDSQFDPNNAFSADRAAIAATDAQLRAVRDHLYLRDIENRHNLGVQDQAATSADAMRIHAGESTVCVPKGLEYVKNDSNVTQAGNKCIPMMALTDDHTSGVYGVPLPLLRNAGALRGNIAGQNEIYRNTLIFNANMLGSIATTAFMHIYVHDGGEYCDTIFGRKAFVDDTQFVSFGLDEAQKHGVEIIEDDTATTAPAPPLSSVIVDGKTKNTVESNNITEEDVERAVTKILAENADASARATVKGGKKRARKTKAAILTPEKERTEDAAPPTTNFVVKINVSHLMNDKMLEHLFHTGAVDMTTYQNMLLNRNGFSAMQFKKPPTTAQKLIGDLMRDPAAPAPREDSYQPEGVGLSDPSMKSRRIVPTGVLLELARFNGDVDKWEASKKQEEAASHQRTTAAIKKKRKREAEDKKADKKAKKKAKKAEKPDK